jgi:vacuolar protein sorting-associated protein 11
VGFANGAVTLIRGDLIHERGAKQRTVFESEEPITGVEFQDVNKLTTLYVATTGRILKLVISGKGQGQPARAIEDSGCGVGCMTADKSNGDIVVVRDLDGRGPCVAFDGPKSLVKVYGDYLAIVSPPANTTASKSNTLRRFGGSQADDLFSTSTFTLLDIDLRFVAHSESLVSQVKAAFMIWGDLFTLTMDGKVSTACLGYHKSVLIMSDLPLS